MSDRFICIACWQEFMVSAAEHGSRGGKVVCPHCGYVQTATALPGGAGSSVSPAVAEFPASGTPVRATLADMGDPDPVRATAGYESTGTEEDSEPQMGEESTSELPDVPDSFEGEPTPPLGFTPPFDEGDDPDAPFSDQVDAASAVSITQKTAFTSSDSIPEAPAQFIWQLKTSSGLKLKFNDMESLLGWRQKVSTTAQAEISPDGLRWADFSTFVREYEETADPWQAFLRAANLDEDEPPPPTSSTVSQTSLRTLNGQSGESGHVSPANGSKAITPRPGYSSDTLTPSLPKATAPNQFTFQVTQKPKSPVGKYFLLGVLGVVLMAGAVVALLYFSNQL